MKILIDADGCPVISIVESIAKKFELEVVIVVNIHHRIISDYCKVIQVDEGRDVADFKIVNLLEVGDIVITQDYGLAAMVLARRAYAINQNGMIYNNDNMEVLLMQRFVAKKEREKGNKVRGAKKRTAIMDKEFSNSFIQLLQKFEGGELGLTKNTNLSKQMSKIQLRNEISNEFKWDVESMYGSVDEWEYELKKLDEAIDLIERFKGNILNSAKSLEELIVEILSNERKMNNLYTFAKMKLDEDTNDSVHQSMTMRAEMLSTRLSAKTSFVIPELLSQDEKIIEGYIEERESLKVFERYFKEILRQKPHILSESEEEILAEASEVLSGAAQAFGMLNNADLKFPAIKDENGNDLELSHGNFVPTMENKNRAVRQSAFEKYYSVYENHKNIMASLVGNNVRSNVFNAKVRKFNSARHAALFENKIPEAVYDQLIDAVNENLPAMHKYMSIRKRALELEELHMYDLYVPIVSDIDIKIPYDEAKELTISALNPLGKDYVDVVKSAFKEGWIDVYENKGKRSGAYSWGTYDSKPFIMLNYHETLDNAFTLIHEMGHSMHSYLTRKMQPYVYGEYSIFVAEVASTTNEALLNQHLLKTVEDPKEKLYILNHYLEQFRGTIYRQTMFAEFERDIHKMVENGEALTADKLSSHYKSLNQKYYGNEMIVDDEIALEWARIPHFYYNFYVYQYATGFSAAIALSNKILNEGQPAVDKYLEFLSSGSSEDSIKILQKAGADMLTKEPVANALKIFAELVDEMEKLLF